MIAEDISAVLLRAMRDADYRETLFGGSGDVAALSEQEQWVAKDFSPERIHALVGALIIHEVLPVRASERVWIVPSWSAALSPEVEIAIRLEPGIAFGNGTHATTRDCLLALEKWLRPGDKVVDLGTGSGILSIAAAKLGASSVRALDIARAPVEMATLNAARNGVGELVTVEEGSLERLRGADPLPDVLVANLLTPILLDLFRQGLAQVVRPGGLLIVSGLLANHVPLVERAARAQGLRRAQAIKLDGWAALVYRRPRANRLARIVSRIRARLHRGTANHR